MFQDMGQVPEHLAQDLEAASEQAIAALPDWRGRGITRALMITVMDWASDQGCERVVLHASEAGRALYRALGFEGTNEMRWAPPRQP